jgi:hypothetical protein
MGAGEEKLSGAWTHSFEEDTESEHVFRRASYPFPASRRPRDTLDFGAGQMMAAMPGPDDKLQRSTSVVTPLGMRRYRLGDGRELEVIEAGSDVLRVRMG